ncbi:hypothetical protein PanWU01x14_204960 [Parasponia andersonii]|uniref:Tf2-1-like SH3-like domain-containing protein n=1 Tax=Parasponia andersonii TaxID=3476 RepID=A0A2P5BWF4_PARAD|nr:hypothetical protein PanWU01x14_204960 [Parasponia andersonii]
MLNRSTGLCPFSVVYTKLPNHTVDLAILPKSKSKAAATMAHDFDSILRNVKAKLQSPTLSYKQAADQCHRHKVFNVGDLVMVHLRKERFPVGTYSKLKPRKLGPFPVEKRINDNAYVITLPPDLSISSTFNVSNIYPYHPPDASTMQLAELESSSSRAGEN